MNKLSFISIIAVIVAGVLLMNSTKSLSKYATFELARQSNSKVKIVGILDKNKDVEYDPSIDPNTFSFYMIDSNEESKKVVVNQAKMRDFELSENVVVTGKFKSDVFYASDILVKCPSKYKDQELALKKEG